MEVWKDIGGYEGLYQVSNMGNVKSLSYRRTGNECILKFKHSKDGYCQVRLHRNGKHRQCYIHRLVAQAFIPNEEGKPQVDHINTIRNDNRVENLRWVSHKENLNNEITKTRKPNSKKILCGGFIFNCISDCANYYNASPQTVRNMLSGSNKMSERFKNLGLKYIEERVA